MHNEQISYVLQVSDELRSPIIVDLRGSWALVIELTYGRSTVIGGPDARPKTIRKSVDGHVHRHFSESFSADVLSLPIPLYTHPYTHPYLYVLLTDWIATSRQSCLVRVTIYHCTNCVQEIAVRRSSLPSFAHAVRPSQSHCVHLPSVVR